MSRKSSVVALVELLLLPIAFTFITLGHIIMFFENINKYNLWKRFFIILPFFLIANFISFCFIDNGDTALVMFGFIWLSFFAYWISLFNKKDFEERKEITSHIGIETANCPYCGRDLDEIPHRKTRCPHCGEFMYIRTRPSDKKRILVREENIEELVSKWKGKRNDKKSTN